MQRFELTEINTATGVPEVVGQGCQFRNGALCIDWVGGIYRGQSIVGAATDLTAMHPGLTMVMIDQGDK